MGWPLGIKLWASPDSKECSHFELLSPGTTQCKVMLSNLHVCWHKYTQFPTKSCHPPTLITDTCQWMAQALGLDGSYDIAVLTQNFKALVWQFKYLAQADMDGCVV